MLGMSNNPVISLFFISFPLFINYPIPTQAFLIPCRTFQSKSLGWYETQTFLDDDDGKVEVP